MFISDPWNLKPKDNFTCYLVILLTVFFIKKIVIFCSWETSCGGPVGNNLDKSWVFCRVRVRNLREPCKRFPKTVALKERSGGTQGPCGSSTRSHCSPSHTELHYSQQKLLIFKNPHPAHRLFNPHVQFLWNRNVHKTLAARPRSAVVVGAHGCCCSRPCWERASGRGPAPSWRSASSVEEPVTRAGRLAGQSSVRGRHFLANKPRYLKEVLLMINFRLVGEKVVIFRTESATDLMELNDFPVHIVWWCWCW